MNGYTSTVLAYGQTGTGKTTTMEGNILDPVAYGIIPRSINRIFETLHEPKFSRVTCSYLEIYNEELSDLLADNNNRADGGEKIEIMNGKEGTCCRGLIEKEVATLKDVLDLIQKAVQSRRMGETKMNKRSSRSHCIFTVHVYSRCESVDGSGNNMEYHGKLHMVDLAGSENAKSSELGSRQSPSGSTRERERKNINTSLLTLGRVISAVKNISLGKKNERVPYRSVSFIYAIVIARMLLCAAFEYSILHKSHFQQHDLFDQRQKINYRDSKLTRVLQDSLGGRSKTVIIATVSPSDISISESISTLNYAQAANGIINKPIAEANQYLKNSSEAGMSIAGETSVQQWYDVECKLRYMEAQVEEAKAALARKNQQNQVLASKAAKVEKQLATNQKVLHQAVERIDLLDSALNEERKLTTSLSQELKVTEESLLRTNAILQETQRTEEKLTFEARLLIQAVETSMNDSDKLHTLLVEERQRDKDRKAATKSFHRNAASTLNEIDNKMKNIVDQEKMFCKVLVKASSEEAKTGQTTLVSTVDTLKDINTNVKSAVGAIKDLCSEESSILSLFESSTLQIHSEIAQGTQDIHTGKDNLSTSANTARETLADHSRRFQSLSTQANADTSNILLSLTSKIDSAKKEILNKANALIDTTSKLAVCSAETRNQLSEVLSKVEERSTSSMKQISDCLLQQHSQTLQSVKTFTAGMEHLNEAQVALQKEKSLISKRGKAQAGDISSQSVIISHQSKALADAQQQQHKMHADALSTVMKGLQVLLQKEFEKLDQKKDAQFSAFTSNNKQVDDLNGKIGLSTRNIIKEVVTINNDLAVHVDALSKNDRFILDEFEKSNVEIMKISQISDETSLFVQENGMEIHERMNELTNVEGQLQKSMNTFNQDKRATANLLSKDVRDYAISGFSQINKNAALTTKLVTDEVIPHAVQAVKKCEDDCKSIVTGVSTHYAQIQHCAANNQHQMKGAVSEVTSTADNLQQSVALKCSTFHKSILAPHKKYLEENRVKARDEASVHLKAAKAGSATMRNLVSSTSEQISTHVKTDIRVDEDTAAVPSKANIEYNDTLSSTRAEHLIVGTLALKLESLQDENRRMMSPMKTKSNSGEHVPDEVKLSISPLSLMSANNSPERSNTKVVRF